MRRTLVLVAGLAALVFAVGCGSSNDDSGDSASAGTAKPKAKEVTVALVLPGFDNPYFRDIRDGAQAAAKSLPGVKVEVAGPPSQTQSQAMLDDIQAEVTKGVDAIGLQPYDPDLFGAVVRRVKAANIPMVGLGAEKVGDVELTATMQFDQAGATTGAMKHLVEQLDGKGEIGVLDVPGNADISGRLKAARAALSGTGVKIVADAPMDCQLKALNATEDILQKRPAINGMFVPCGTAAVYSARAFAATKRPAGSYVIWGFDGTPDELKAIKSGRMAGTVRFDGRKIGGLMVKALAAVARGEQPAAADLTAPYDLVTKDNVDAILQQAGS